MLKICASALSKAIIPPYQVCVSLRHISNGAKDSTKHKFYGYTLGINDFGNLFLFGKNEESLLPVLNFGEFFNKSC